MSGNRFKLNLRDFEGPLDILFFIVQKNKYDIKKLPLLEVIDQYLEYVKKIDSSRADLALEGHYMLMAAKLIRIKAKLLFPRRGSEAEEIALTQEEIGELLEFYGKIKKVAEDLENRNKLYWDLFPSWKAQAGYVESYDHGIYDIVSAVERILNRIKKENDSENVVVTDSLDIRRRLLWLIEFFRRKHSTFFTSLLPDYPTLRDVLEVFLAILELTKRGALRMLQEDYESDILVLSTPKIKYCKGIEDLNG